jgi:hypothetical protein
MSSLPPPALALAQSHMLFGKKQGRQSIAATNPTVCEERAGLNVLLIAAWCWWLVQGFLVNFMYSPVDY